SVLSGPSRPEADSESRSLNYFIRAQQQFLRNRDAEGLGGVEVDDQCKLHRLSDRKIGGICTAKDAVDGIGAHAGYFRVRYAVGDHGASLFFESHGWYALLGRCIDDFRTVVVHESGGIEHHCLGALPHELADGTVDLVRCSNLDEDRHETD